MFLVQLLLPLYENTGERIPAERFAQLRDELTERYGGVTAFLRSPAHGTWKEASGAVERDEVVVCEVMVETLDRSWWEQYRKALERRFVQRELVVRAIELERL
jgi:hypothetical protein